MGKVDCVMEACRESYDKGVSDGFSDGFSQSSEDIACRLLNMGKLSVLEISNITNLSLEKINELKRNL